MDSTPVDAAAVSSSTLLLKFVDSRSGAAVAPGKLMLDGKPVDFQVEAGSLVAVETIDGNHKIGVEASDYDSIEFVASVAGENTPVVEIELDSNRSELTTEVEDGTAVIEGFVTDSDTGALLPDVKLTMPDASMSTTTEESGYYSFTLKVPGKSEESRTVVNLEVSAEGFQARRIKNLTVVSGERRLMPIRLESVDEGTTEPVTLLETDEAAPDGPLRTYDWAFDVTIK